ncbi:MAG TPA: deoxyribonuclease [Candidatus Nanopusillus sp.]|nr:deoxyribonuclease [Candidatus Nanopusillus sp.]HIP90377.1 deoxyribonuclease [Candidatus Nanopusillus sp.]
MIYRKPVKVGDKFKVEIKRITKRGDGYIRIKGLSVFVKNVDIGWSGKIVITKLGPTYAIAEPSE